MISRLLTPINQEGLNKVSVYVCVWGGGGGRGLPVLRRRCLVCSLTVVRQVSVVDVADIAEVVAYGGVGMPTPSPFSGTEGE